MKPAQAKDMPFACDLSGITLTQAYEEVTKEPYSTDSRDHYIVLKVPSQQVGLAAILIVGWNISLEIDFTYAPDEWSLRNTHFFMEDGKLTTEVTEVWSPGA
jgi:hypothetical protein